MTSKKHYKVEAKGSLWEVTLECGEYSDWDIKHFIFSGNNEEEVWEFIKIWANEGGIGGDSFKWGLVWNGQQHQFAPLPDWNIGMHWGTGYGDAFKVEIKRAHVVYVKPE